MSDKGGQSQTTQTEPPSYVKPYITGDPKKGIVGVLPEAQAQYQSDKPSYYPNDTVADFSPEQQLAMTGTANRAISGSPLNTAASDYLTGAIGGDYLNGGNPADDAVFKSIQAHVMPAVNAQFGMAGASGGGLHQGAVAEGLANAYAPYAYNNYRAERGMQQDAAGMAPQQAGQDYIDLAALQGVGDQQQQQQQAEIGGDVNAWNFGQNVDQAKLNNLIAAVYGAPGSSSYSSTSGPGTAQMILGSLLGLGGVGVQAAGLF
jgi:hypothetical protein